MVQVQKELNRNAAAVNFQDDAYIHKTAEKILDVGRKMEYLLNTGNLVSKGGADISQTTGFTVVAEKLNFFRLACLPAAMQTTILEVSRCIKHSKSLAPALVV